MNFTEIYVKTEISPASYHLKLNDSVNLDESRHA